MGIHKIQQPHPHKDIEMGVASKGASVFEQIFGSSSAPFKTISEVNSFIERRRGALSTNVCNFAENNLVLPQGNVFSISSDNINTMIDNTLEEQQVCLKRFR